MSAHRLAEMTWEEVQGLQNAVGFLPIGATEAHGPHLPLSTDVIISEAMCEEAARLTSAAGREAVIFPPLAYTAAEFASEFSGTVSVRPQIVTDLVVDIARAAAGMGLAALALANSHLDPVHLGSLADAVKICERESILPLAFPNITRKPWALELTDEFKSGACHAGQFEGSIVMASRGDLVRTEIQSALPDNPASLSVAIQAGKTRFDEAGGPRAYFGYPSQATAEEGERTVSTLGRQLAESVVAALESEE